MPMAQEESIAFQEIDRRFRSTAKLLFGGEVGNMAGYSDWLSDNFSPRESVRSGEGEEIVLSVGHYPGNARFQSLKDVDFEKKWAPLSINEIKDIDSLIGAVSERISYTGNIILGNSKFVEESTGIIDSYYVFHSERAAHSKFLAYTTQVGVDCECVFGGNGFGWTSYSIKVYGTIYCTRCFEVSKSDNSSDCHYCHGVSGCNGCMFTFNVKNARNMIGNLELTADKYSGLKAKLLLEMREILAEKKRLPSLIGLSCMSAPPQKDLPRLYHGFSSKPPAREDLSLIRDAFSSTSKIIFGKELSPIEEYGAWLLQNTNTSTAEKSCFSGKKLQVPDFVNFLSFPKNRLVDVDESYFLGENAKAGEGGLEKHGFRDMHEVLSSNAFFCPIWETGIVKNNSECPINLTASNCYKSVLNINAKSCAYSFWPRDSECLFGVNEVRSSSFCINCYHSENLQRCFEVDASDNCSDCYFCHNCENCQECMFSFNVKNKRYAIGNSEVPREEYMRLKRMLLDGLCSELLKNHEVKRSIFQLS